jgi:DNA gyrase subunit B
MNVQRAKSDSEVVDSDEVKYVLATIGFDPNAKDPYKKLRTHRIMLLADADFDGAHINSLVLTLLYKYLPGLFERGYVFVVDAPEYYAYNPKSKEYFTGDSVELVRKQTKNLDVHHLKGWGEAPVELLETLAFDPKVRKLIRIGLVDKQGHKDFCALMGEDSGYRKELLGI